MITSYTQNLIDKAKYNALHNKKANEAVAKSIGISVDELQNRFRENNKELYNKFENKEGM